MKPDVKRYYLRDDILDELFKSSMQREFVAAKYTKDGLVYFKRPSAVQYPSDIEEFVKRGATSFHISVEKWSNPSYLESEPRVGWDLIIDIDTSPKSSLEETIEFGKVVASTVSTFLKKYSIPHGAKFSGSRGFHLFVPQEAFPEKINFRPFPELYPELPRILVSYIRFRTYESVRDALIERFGMKKILEVVGGFPSDIDVHKMLNIGIYSPELYFESAITADKQVGSIADAEREWGERHLFRAPYSFNEKTWLVSVPINPSKIMDFSLEMARPDNISIEDFFVRANGEAGKLVVDALDWWKKGIEEKKEIKRERPVRRIERKVPEEEFPPCMKLILKGLKDGRKRSLFSLITFLKKMNWSMEEIEKKLMEWNERNEKPLSKRMIVTQLRWHERRDLMPANCYSELFYKSIGVCRPDERCAMIKNPVNYPRPSGEMRWKCEKCGKVFKTKKGLSVHRRVHSRG